jgi:hypothetical protein
MYGKSFDERVIKSAKSLGIPVKGAEDNIVDQVRTMIRTAQRILEPMIALSKGNDPKAYQGDVVKFVSYMKKLVAFSEQVSKLVKKRGRVTIDPVRSSIASSFVRYYRNAIEFIKGGNDPKQIMRMFMRGAMSAKSDLDNALSNIR